MMLRQARLFFLSIFCCFLVNQNASATLVNTDNYDIYIGDISGDGRSDFYFKSKKSVVLLAGDIIVPILIAKGKDFVIFRNGASFKPPIEFSLFSDADIKSKLANGSLKKATSGTDYLTLASGVQGQSSLLLKSNEVGVWNITLVSTASSLLPIAIVSDSSSSSSPAAGSAQATWRAVVSGMVNNDPSIITQYFDASVIVKYQSLFSVLKKDLVDIGNQLGEIQPLYISDKVAIYVVKKIDDTGDSSLYTIKFVKDANNQWKVNQL